MRREQGVVSATTYRIQRKPAKQTSRPFKILTFLRGCLFNVNTTIKGKT